MGEFVRKFTEDEELEIASEYIEGRTTMDELGKKHGCSKATISRIVSRTGVLDELEKKADARSRLALIKLKMESAQASGKLIRLSQKERDDSMVYADIQLLQQILDRAGVRATKTEDGSLTIRFAEGAGFSLGRTEEAPQQSGQISSSAWRLYLEENWVRPSVALSAAPPLPPPCLHLFGSFCPAFRLWLSFCLSCPSPPCPSLASSDDI